MFQRTIEIIVGPSHCGKDQHIIDRTKCQGYSHSFYLWFHGGHPVCYNGDDYWRMLTFKCYPHPTVGEQGYNILTKHHLDDIDRRGSFLILQDYDWRRIDEILWIIDICPFVSILITTTTYFPHLYEYVTHLTYNGYADKSSEYWMWKTLFQKCASWKEFKSVVRNKDWHHFVHYDNTDVLKMYSSPQNYPKIVDSKLKKWKNDDDVLKRIEELEDIFLYVPGQDGAKEAQSHFYSLTK